MTKTVNFPKFDLEIKSHQHGRFGWKSVGKLSLSTYVPKMALLGPDVCTRWHYKTVERTYGRNTHNLRAVKKTGCRKVSSSLKRPSSQLGCQVVWPAAGRSTAGRRTFGCRCQPYDELSQCSMFASVDILPHFKVRF